MRGRPTPRNRSKNGVLEKEIGMWNPKGVKKWVGRAGINPEGRLKRVGRTPPFQ